ncbi:hypothetical protein P43SY_006125 [Pythium insidiosum]|uniref:TFIIS N-terminal domain-containing protein n=1 Tax=Pythium insidiosum TaxID=114742 RepID=A0AAD5LGG4_PYTIN|nr:hypothetical protein P43SY_006125 [Pythium insidiosum]
MTAKASDVAAMAQQIERLTSRPGWQSDNSVASDLMPVLGKLTTVRADVDLLKSTNIGRVVKKLRKHDDDVVKGYSTTLMTKWMKEVGIQDEKPSAPPSKSSGSSAVPRQSPTAAAAAPPADPARLENARKRLQDKYAAEKARREARTVQVLNRPIANGRRRGTTISAAPSKSSIARSRISSTTMSTRPSAPTPAAAARRPLPSPGAIARSRPNSADRLDPHEAHQRRREKLLALRQRGAGQQTLDEYEAERRRPASATKRPEPRSQQPSAPAKPAPPADPRKALLDRMYPRVCGVSEPPPSAKGKKSGAAAYGKASTPSGRSSKQKPVSYTEGQREVIQWLKGLDVDMSSYAQAFLDNGFDSIKLLNEVKPRDLESMVPKAGHQRVIEKALQVLKRKHATAAGSRPRSADRDRDRDLPRRKPSRRDSYFDEDSDDSFVVSDGDEYAPGAITQMLMKNRKRRRLSIDSTDSFNMEASFDEIQREEERSKRYGEYEDYREELRNEEMARKKKKK